MNFCCATRNCARCVEARALGIEWDGVVSKFTPPTVGPVAIRPAKATDQAFVANSWISSLAGPKRDWGSAEQHLNVTIDRLLDDPRTKVLIACEVNQSDRIVGWCAYAKIPGARVLEFILVRQQRRGQGIARDLLTRAGLLGPGAPLTALFPTTRLKAVQLSPQDFLQ